MSTESIVRERLSGAYFGKTEEEAVQKYMRTLPGEHTTKAVIGALWRAGYVCLPRQGGYLLQLGNQTVKEMK